MFPLHVTAMLLLLYSVCEMLFEDGTFIFFSFSIKAHYFPLLVFGTVAECACVSVCSGVCRTPELDVALGGLGGWPPPLPAGGVRHMLPEVTCFRFWEGAGHGEGPREGLWILDSLLCLLSSVLLNC